MITKAFKILILEDEFTDAEIIKRHLNKNFFDIETMVVSNQSTFMQALHHFKPDFILSDNTLPQFSALEALEIVKKHLPEIPFILITGTVSEEFAVKIIKDGADDYLLKDRLARLPAAINAALEKRRIEKEKKAAAEKLLRSEENYRTLIERVTDAFIAFDTNWCFTYVNKKAAEMLYRDAESLIGKNYYSEFQNDNEQPLNLKFPELIEDQHSYFDEYVTPDGKWYERHIYASADGFSVYFTDITERKTIESDLEKSNERFKYATQAMSDIIWEQNYITKQTILYDSKEKLLGYKKISTDELSLDGKYTIEEDKERIRISFARAKLNPLTQFWNDEYQVYSKNGSVLFITNHAFFFRDEKGIAIRAIGAISDITERKKLEEELLQQQHREQLRITAFTLNAQEKERDAIGQELHDNVNQILVGTKLLLSVIQKSPEQTNELVESSIENLQLAIDENRKIAHALVAPDFESKSLTEQLKNLTSKMLTPAGIAVHYNWNSYYEPLLQDNQKLTLFRIAQEQCTNIVKYSKASEVILFLNTTDGICRMQIKDNGVGMHTEQKENGVGLNNIKARITTLNGSVHVDTASGKGFSLTVQMPCKEQYFVKHENTSSS